MMPKSKFKKVSVAVGVAAYNEGNNIAELLHAILKLRTEKTRVTRCIVVADGCTDDTVSKVRSLKSKRIDLIIHRKRCGQAVSQSKIIKSSTSDYLVLLNGDIQIKDKNFIENIIIPFFKNSKIGLVGGSIEPLPSENKFEEIINYGVAIKQELFEGINHLDNIFLCHGRVRAFSRAFMKTFTWKKIINEDAYSYLSCKKNNFEFYYQPSAAIYYRSPQNLKDHMRQSKRFLYAKKELRKYFTEEDLNYYYAFPIVLTVKVIAKYIVKNPILFLEYLGVQGLVLFSRVFDKEMKINFMPSMSSKVLYKNI
jgi:glycosyltransferase involved in cell wall biosynthesis